MPPLIVLRFDISLKYSPLSRCAQYIFLLSGLYFGGYKYIIIINLSTPVIKYIYTYTSVILRVQIPLQRAVAPVYK